MLIKSQHNIFEKMEECEDSWHNLNIIEELLEKLRSNIQLSDLTNDELLGGIFSELVRGKT